MLIGQSGGPPEATCIIASDERLQRLKALCSPACQLISLQQSSGQPKISQAQQPQHFGAGTQHGISSFQELLQLIVRSHTGAGFVIAYAMKESRGLALAERGFFPLAPMDGLSFLPLDLDRDLELQSPFHAILHKAGRWAHCCQAFCLVVVAADGASRLIPAALLKCRVLLDKTGF